MAIAKRTAAVLGLVPFLVGFAGAAPAVADENGSARGSFSIENQELTDAETSNEVKVGCDFRIDFFGFALQSVPVTFTVMPPSGNGETLETRVATLEDPNPDTGNDLSGSLYVNLLDDLKGIQPAQAQDFDYKVRVEATVKSTPGTDVVKSKNLFIICDTGVAEDVTPAPVTPAPVTPAPESPAPVTPAPVADSGTLPASEVGTLPVQQAAAPVEEGATLPETGTSSPWLLLIAAPMIALGLALRRFSRPATA